MTTAKNHSAFPLAGESFLETGLTKREYFACQILVGLASRTGISTNDDWLSSQSVYLADKLIAELNKPIA